MADFLLDPKHKDYQEHLEKFMQAIAQPGVKIVKIEKKRKVRSISLNNYYWLCVSYISDYTGISDSDLHDEFKKGPLSSVIWKDYWEMDLSTTNLTNEELWRLVMLVRDFARKDLGLIIPDPYSTLS